MTTLQPFWLSAIPGPLSASPTADAVIDDGLEAGLRLSAMIRRKILGLMRTVKPTREPSRFLAEVRKLLRRYEPDLARTISDAHLAAWISGGRRIAAMLPVVEESAGLPPGPPRGLLVAGADDEPDVELPVIDEAVRDLAQRRVMTRRDYDAASQQARRQAFTVARLATDQAVEKVRDALQEAIAEGQTLRTFSQRLADDLETSHLGDGHVETVFRTGAAVGYARGMEAVRNHELVRSELPFVETVPTFDDRLTKICAIAAESGLDGTGIYYADDREWHRIKNPRHFNCRCGTIYHTIESAAERGIKAALRWQREGRRPLMESLLVPRVPIDLPAGWIA